MCGVCTETFCHYKIVLNDNISLKFHLTAFIHLYRKWAKNQNQQKKNAENQIDNQDGVLVPEPIKMLGINNIK